MFSESGKLGAIDRGLLCRGGTPPIVIIQYLNGTPPINQPKGLLIQGWHCWVWRWLLSLFFQVLSVTYSSQVKGIVFARQMHSTTKFAMTVLSKCVTHAGFAKVAWTLRGIPFQVGTSILRSDLWIHSFQPTNSSSETVGRFHCFTRRSMCWTTGRRTGLRLLSLFTLSIVAGWTTGRSTGLHYFLLLAVETSFFQRCSRDRSLSLVFIQHVKYRHRSCLSGVVLAFFCWPLVRFNCAPIRRVEHLSRL